jgi:hypothetical protein
VSFPDAVTAEDVLELGYTFWYFLAEHVGADWEDIGDSEDGQEYRRDVSVDFLADESCNVDVEFTFDVDGKLVIKDEALRWQVDQDHRCFLALKVSKGKGWTLPLDLWRRERWDNEPWRWN